MIWLTWRQHRKQALFAVAGLAVLAAVLIPTGLQMYASWEDTGLRECMRTVVPAELVAPSAVEACEQAHAAFDNRYGTSYVFIAVLLVFLPMLAGMFWGATLVAREVEHGTHRFAWTQGVTRLKWMLVKGGLVVAGTALVATAFAVLMSWWLTPLVGNSSLIQFPFFDLYGLAPVGYTVFAVALGVFAGAVSRKILPAMAITMVGFVAARIALGVGGRPRFQSPVELTYPAATDLAPNRFRGDWILSQRIYDEAGNFITSGSMTCSEGCTEYNVWTYQPGDRFWLFQSLETGILVGLAGLLFLVAVYLVRRRIA
jgi:ABC-2 family transporter